MAITTSAKEVIFSLALVSYLFVSRITQRLLNWFSQNSTERWHMVSRKKPLDFGNNPDHVTVGLRSGLRLRLFFNITHFKTVLRFDCGLVVHRFVLFMSTMSV